MSIWDSITGAFKRRTSRETFSTAMPMWDTGALQYPTLNPYVLANEGFAKNELIFACVNRIANAVAEAPLWEFDDSGETPEEIPHSPMRDLLEHPAPNLTEEEFWKITEIYLKTAGFCVWEKIRPNVGRAPIELGLLRADWVSFKSTKDKPIGLVSYHPPGFDLEPKPVDEFIVFQYFDPRNPQTKGISPTAIAMRMTSVDNATTDFLKLFFQHGAVFNGILTSDLNITDQEAKRIRDNWKIAHGGVQNWSDVAVLGKNVKYQQTQMDFEQMAFNSLDARAEARICTVFNVPPIVLGTITGLSASTYHNYQEAKLGFYQDNIKPEWRYLAGVIREQLLPEFHPNEDKQFFVEFHTADIQSLQPDRDAAVDRANKMYVGNLWARDEAREETDKDPIDGDWLVFADGSRIPKPDVTNPSPHPIFDKPKEIAAPKQVEQVSDSSQGDTTQATDTAEKALERKQFKQYLAHGRDASKFKFKYLTPREQYALKHREPRDFSRILFVISFEQMHPDADRLLAEEGQRCAKILNTLMPTTLELIREPHEITPILARYDPRDTLIMDWTDSEVASALVEQSGFAHTSSPPATQKLAFDREQMFLLLRQHRIRVPEFMIVYSVDSISEWTKYPAVMRPNECHGSEDMQEVTNAQEAKDCFERISEMHPRKVILMEKISPAREFSVGLWSDGRTIETFPISETNMAAMESDMKDELAKSPDGPTAEEMNIIPARLSADLESKLRLQSVEIFKFFGITIYGRVDWRMYEGEGDPICIDVNPEPEITELALNVEMAKARGMTYGDFIIGIIHKAIEYYRNLDGLNAVPTNGNGNGSEKSLLSKQFAEAMREFREALNQPAVKSESNSNTAPVTVYVTNQMPEQKTPIVTVTNRMPMQRPPTVNLPAPIVNVAAPEVKVTNEVNPTPVEITNDVQPTPVEIQNTVETPMVVNRVEVKNEAPVVIETKPKDETVVIERGKDGRISGMTKKAK